MVYSHKSLVTLFIESTKFDERELVGCKINLLLERCASIRDSHVFIILILDNKLLCGLYIHERKRERLPYGGVRISLNGGHPRFEEGDPGPLWISGGDGQGRKGCVQVVSSSKILRCIFQCLPISKRVRGDEGEKGPVWSRPGLFPGARE